MGVEVGIRHFVRRRIVGQLILETDVKHHLMLATVTGVAPFVSILRTQKIERERGATTSHQFGVIHEDENWFDSQAEAAEERREGDMVGTSYVHRSKNRQASRLATSRSEQSSSSKLLQALLREIDVTEMGHTQANTTYRYVNANVETAKRAAAALNAFNAESTEAATAAELVH